MGKLLRRTFLIGTGMITGGLAVGFYLVRKPHENPLLADLAPGEASFSLWIRIGADSSVTVFHGRAEMGQGISTTLPALVAEELDYPLDMIRVEHGPASAAYFNGALMDSSVNDPDHRETALSSVMRTITANAGKVLGLQVTGGSTSTRDAFVKMRQAGAAAKAVLLQAAADKAGAAVSQMTWGPGTISGPDGKVYTFAELLEAASRLTPPANPTLKSREDWTVLGKPQKRTDHLAKVTGAPIFGIDVMAPEMVYGTVRMSPRFGAGIKRADTSAAEAMPGVEKIIRLNTRFGQGFGVIAKTTWHAFKAAEAIDVEWDDAAYPADSEAIFALLRDRLGSTDAGSAIRDDGDVEIAFADAPREAMVEADYEVPFVAHATMEPMNATAQLKDGKLTLWSPNQAPTFHRMVVASELDMSGDDIDIVTTMMGGGFGRRSETDFSVFAALMARETAGRPIKVTWTREEDMRHDQYRPAAVGRFRARLGDDGLPQAVDMRIAIPSVLRSYVSRVLPRLSPGGPDDTACEGAANQPYRIANYRVGAVDVDLSIPLGIWRSVGASYNGFFHECFLDEMSVAGGRDPLDLRLALMQDYPVARGVMEKLGEISSWQEPVAAGRARGMAFTLSFGGWVGTVVDVLDTPSGIAIDKVFMVADLGTVLDSGIVHDQLVSGAIFGFSHAMGQEITFADGMVEQSNFHDHDALRMRQSPSFEIALLENVTMMGGAGEIGTPPSIAALANAVSRLTGQRIRRLPMSKDVSFV